MENAGINEIYEAIKQHMSRPEPIRISTIESYGYVLSETIRAPRDLPPYDISLVDGLAISSPNDLSRNYRLVGGVDPRDAGRYVLKPGEAVPVDTGFPVPHNTYAVIPYEDARINDGMVMVEKNVVGGENIARRGSDIGRGSIVAEANTVVTGGLMKLLVDLGVYSVWVYPKPRVGVIGVGDELCEPGPEGCRGKPSSNRYMVARIVEEYGGIVVSNKIVPDNQDEILKEIIGLRRKADIIITIGGTGMGGRDYLRSIITGLNGLFKWSSIRVMPGRRIMGLITDDTLLVSLPGLTGGIVSGLFYIITPYLHYLQGGSLSWKVNYVGDYELAGYNCSTPRDGKTLLCLARIDNGGVVLENIGKYREAYLKGEYYFANVEGVPARGVKIPVYRIKGLTTIN